MTTSGTSTWNPNLQQIIRAAALKIQVIGEGATMSAQTFSDFMFNLNSMLKSWDAQQIHLWVTAEATLFPQPGQTRYAIGGSATDHVTETYYQTAITSDEALGQTTISVDDTTNITDGDHIGFVLDDGSLQWTTVSSHTSSTVSVAAALTDSAAEGNAVFNYTTRIVRPLKITDARRYDVAAETDTPVSLISRNEYNALPRKIDVGSINEAYYDPQLSTGFLSIWQVPATATELLKFTWQRPIQDFTINSETADLPQEWMDAVIYNLAYRMTLDFTIDPRIVADVKQRAMEYLDIARGFDREPTSIFIQPDME